MRTNLIRAAAPAAIAIAALLLSLRSAFGDTLLAAYMCVAAVIAVGALEYRSELRGPSRR